MIQYLNLALFLSFPVQEISCTAINSNYRPFIQSGMWDEVSSSFIRHPDLKEIPTLWELVDPKHRRLITLISTANVVDRPFLAPPGVPADRVKTLRGAFWTAFNSDEYKRDAMKVFRLQLKPTEGKVVQKFMGQVMAASPQDVALLKEVLKK